MKLVSVITLSFTLLTTQLFAAVPMPRQLSLNNIRDEYLYLNEMMIQRYVGNRTMAMCSRFDLTKALGQNDRRLELREGTFFPFVNDTCSDLGFNYLEILKVDLQKGTIRWRIGNATFQKAPSLRVTGATELQPLGAPMLSSCLVTYGNEDGEQYYQAKCTIISVEARGYITLGTKELN